jgi:hypothetical protein
LEVFLKKIFLIAIAIFATAPAFAQFDVRPNRPDRRGSCFCVELQRRVSGLNYVIRNAQLDSYEARDLRDDVYYGREALDDAMYADSAEQDAICSRGNEDVDNSWRRWQPWVARRGADIGNRCERGF